MVKNLYLSKLLVIISLLCVLSMNIQAKTIYYVSTQGDNNNDGKSLQTPFRTIQRAADLMQPGDVCLIRGGVYREKIVPKRGGTSAEKRIVYRNYKDEIPIIKGSERVAGWVQQGEGLWKVKLSQSFFSSSPYNPFMTKVSGHCIINPENKWSLGGVYLNEKPLSEAGSLAEVEKTNLTWHAVVDGKNTIVYARFEGDPNKELVEVTVRDACFHPGEKVLNYISIQGLTMKMAAPNASGPVYPQQGIVTVYAGKGWVIENCSISDSPCAGLALATGPENWYNEQAATQNENGTIPNIKTSGNHLVRRNTIEHCGQVGIVGMINGHSSVIEGNLIQDINCEQKIGGAETAGIKLHWAIDTIIKNNIIRRVYNAKVAGQNFGLWLDFSCQGTRVTGNIIYDIIDPAKTTPKSFPLYLEANVGPVIIDNNIIIKHPTGPYNNELGALHSVVVHNLVLEGRFQHFNDPTRNVPYYNPNSFKYITRLDAVNAKKESNFRYINKNNLYLGQFSGQDGATEVEGNIQIAGNDKASLKFKYSDTHNGISFKFHLSDELKKRLAGCNVVTSHGLGRFPLVKQYMSDRKGKPFDIDSDIFGNKHYPSENKINAGPFGKLKNGENVFKFSSGSKRK